MAFGRQQPPVYSRASFIFSRIVPALNLIHAMLTDIGRSRSHNEDACASCPEFGAFVLCDGMGGAPAGEVASRLAATRFLESINLPAPTRPVPHPRADLQTDPQARLRAAIKVANQIVHRRSLDDLRHAGMGTTLVALLHVPPPAMDRRTPPDLFLANVGDSRCYRLRDGTFHQLSRDHSFVEEQLLAGQITKEEAARSPMRNYITRAIGPQLRVEPDIDSYRTLPGDLYLLCSDGLTRELTDDRIADLLRHELSARPLLQAALDRACATLIREANQNGGRDNITVILVGVQDGGQNRVQNRVQGDGHDDIPDSDR